MAATTADRVVTELIADTSGHDPKIITSARVVEQASQQMQRSATAAETSANRAFANIATGATRSGEVMVRSVGSYRAGMQQLGFQINDVAQQLAMGTRATTIFAQQSSQFVQAIQLMSGGSSRFAAFMGGPWGIALTAGTAVLAPLIARLFDTRTELQKATDELAENARKTELSRQAHEAYGRTVPGIVASIRAETEALREQNRTLEENQNIRLNDVGDRANRALSARDRVRRELAAAEASTPSGVTGQIARQAQIAALRAQLYALDQTIRQVEQDTAEALVPIARSQAEQAVNPIARIRAEYERMARAAENAAAANQRLRASLPGTLADIYRRRDAAIAAEEERQRREREGTLVRPVTGAVMSQYGADRSGVPINGRRIAGRRHQGVDLRGDMGAPVVAPEGGVATVLNAPGGLGLYVEIRADSGARDLLAHLSAANIRSGQRVEAGQLVGLVGNSGNAAGGPPHLHWQRQVNGRWVDPMGAVGSSGAAQEAEARAREAAQLAERRQRDEERFQAELAGINVDILNARRRQVQTEEEAAADDIAAIRAEQAARDQQIRNEAAERTRRDSAQAATANMEAGILLARSQELAQTRIDARNALMQQRLDERRIETAQRELNDQASVLQARAQLARTAVERRDIELRLLDLQRQEELLAIEKQRNLTAEQRASAIANVNQRYALGQQSVMRQTAGPMESFLNSIPHTAAEMNEALQQVAVQGLASLNDGLAQAATRFLHLGGIAGQVLNQILSDMIRIGLQQAELAIFGGGKGGGGIFSAIGSALGLVSSSGRSNAGLQGLLTAVPGHASGYVGPVGGLGGIDRNVLSINGRPRARVSGSETLAIIPQGQSLGFAGGRAAGGAGYGAPQYNIHIDARDAVLTHAVRAWVREGVEEATARGTMGGTEMVTRISAMRTRQTL